MENKNYLNKFLIIFLACIVVAPVPWYDGFAGGHTARFFPFFLAPLSIGKFVAWQFAIGFAVLTTLVTYITEKVFTSNLTSEKTKIFINVVCIFVLLVTGLYIGNKKIITCNNMARDLYFETGNDDASNTLWCNKLGRI